MRYERMAADALRELLADVDEDLREHLIAAVGDLVRGAAAAERERSVALCRARAERWRTTPAASAPVDRAREEARARANEATYLADLIASDAAEEMTTRRDDEEEEVN